MTFFDDWKKRQEKKTGGEKDAIIGIDRYDREDMEHIAKEMRDYRLSRDKLCEIAEMGAHLTSDTTMSFYKVDAKRRPAADMDPLYVENNKVEEELMTTQEWQRLQTWTEGDLVSSAAAFVSIEDELEALLDKTRKAAEEAEALEKEAQELAAAEDGDRQMKQMVEDWKALGELTDEELEAMAAMQQAIAEAMAAAAAQLEANAQAAGAEVDKAIASAMPAMRKAMAEEADRDEAESTAAMTWGMEPGQLRRLPADERIRLAERLAKIKDFKELTKLIGQMKRLAEAEQTRKVYHSFEEVYDVEIGKDLGRILPGEMLNLVTPETEMDFYRRYSEGLLLQYAMRGDEKVGKGGIILCKDDSYSMIGDPNRWAVSVAIATLSIARDQGRSYVGLNFGSSHELMEFDFRTPEDYTPDKLIDYAEFFFAGGTDFQRPLTRALEILQEEEALKGFIEGDIVFVTDGAAGVSDEWMKNFKSEQERLGFKVWGILIGAFRESEPLWTICDHNVVTISDLLSGEDVKDLFRDL